MFWYHVDADETQLSSHDFRIICRRRETGYLGVFEDSSIQGVKIDRAGTC